MLYVFLGDKKKDFNTEIFKLRGPCFGSKRWVKSSIKNDALGKKRSKRDKKVLKKYQKRAKRVRNVAKRAFFGYFLKTPPAVLVEKQNSGQRTAFSVQKRGKNHKTKDNRLKTEWTDLRLRHSPGQRIAGAGRAGPRQGSAEAERVEQ